MISILAKRRDALLSLSRPSCQNKDRIGSWAWQVGIKACTDLWAPLIDRTLAESSLVKNYFESSYISESRILFTPLLCSSEESWCRNFNSTPLVTQIFLGSRGYFGTSMMSMWPELCSWCLSYVWIGPGELSSKGFLTHHYRSVSIVSQDTDVRNCFNTLCGKRSLVSPSTGESV